MTGMPLTIDVKKELLALKDDGNAVFAKSLIPGDHVLLGARLPDMRVLAKRIAKDDWRSYIEGWDPHYFEDYMLRGLVIAYADMELDERIEQFRDFVPYIDNWSVCDSFCNTWKPKEKEKETVWEFILPFLRTGREFEMRFSAVMMLCHFIDEEHIDRVIGELDSAKSDAYYYMMAKAWTLSVCFVRFPEITMAYLENGTLDEDTLRMTVRKIRESYRVSDDLKKRVKGLV